MHKFLILVALVAVSPWVIGCSEATKKKTEDAGHEIKEAAEATGEAVKEGAHDVGEAVKEGAEGVKDAVTGAGHEAEKAADEVKSELPK
jgi:hypothetical protein